MVTPSGVDDYLAALPEEPRTALEQLRGMIKAAAPEATETISYQMPAFKDHGRMLVYYAAFKDHCSLFPASRAVLDALGDELKPYFTGKGTIRFRAGDPIPGTLVEKIVRARLEENAAHRHRRGDVEFRCARGRRPAPSPSRRRLTPAAARGTPGAEDG